MADFTTVPNELVQELLRQARSNQDYRYYAGGYSAEDSAYSNGYEAGRYGAGDDLEQLLRQHGLWSDR